jgi:tetratricopeptide (TPR) repeat protein
MTQPDQGATEDLFRQQLTRALERFHEPKWLEEHSPLATPYFLGNYLSQSGADNTVEENGEALRELIQETLQSLQQDGEEAKEQYDLLRWSFIWPKPVPQICADLNISRATYYRYRRKAIAQLEKALVQRLRPSLRLEDPPTKSPMVGRTKIASQCLDALQAGKTIAVTGSIGVGKTTLGTYLAACWQSQPVFWFTLRPRLNDHLHSVLFTLAFFLHRQGRSSLWLQLIAGMDSKPEQHNREMTLSLLRHDLKEMNENPPLLCFDDVDLLRPLESEQHAQVQVFLESLRGLAPIIFIGQQVTLDVDHHQSLGGLAPSEVKAMLRQANIELSEADREVLARFTHNVPYLLELFIFLHRSGEPMADILADISTTPSAEFLFSRIWQRLREDERRLLAGLSVFRRPVPADAWVDSDGLKRLITRLFVLQGKSGHLSTIPALQSIIYSQLSAEDREILHLDAATVRSERGDYTAAAYHLIRGGRPATAIRLWDAHWRQEVDQGHSAAALSMFAAISAISLPPPERETLVLLRSRLRLLAGDYSGIMRDLHAARWQDPLHKAQAKRMAGDVSYERGQIDKAIESYQDGIQTLHDLEYEMASSYKEMAKAYAHKPDLDAAWRAAQLARYEVENMMGSIQSDRGYFGEAKVHFEQALVLAQGLNHIEGEGKTRNNLAWVLKQQGDYKEANFQWERAGECYRQIGRLTLLAGIKVNQAAAWTQMGKGEAAVPLLEEALSVFETLGFARGIAITHYNLAETFLALGNMEAAERYAWRSIEDKEPSILPANLYVLAEVRLAQERFHEAESFSRNAIEAATKNQQLLSLAYAYRTLAKCNLLQEKIEAGKRALEQALNLFQQLELPHEIEASMWIKERFIEKAAVV